MRRVIDLAPALTHGLASDAELADTGAVVARRLGAEAATLTHGFAGAVLLAALAVQPRDRSIVFLAAHDIEVAGPLRDLLQLAGARPVAVGSIDRATAAALEAALGPDTAAALYVADDGRRGSHLVALPAFHHAAQRRALPTLVLAPRGADSEALLDAGADLLVLDATTALAGPPLGILAGKPGLIASARRIQASGLGRLTRPAPDHLAAVVEDHAGARPPLVQARRARLGEQLAGRLGLRLLPCPSGVILDLDPATAGATAQDLAHALASAEPALLVDTRAAGRGRLELDLARLDEAGFSAVLDTLARTVEAPIPPAPWP